MVYCSYPPNMVSHSKLLRISLWGIGVNRKQRNIYLTLCVEFPPKVYYLPGPGCSNVGQQYRPQKITIQWINSRETNFVIHRIEIVHNVIHLLLNDWDQISSYDNTGRAHILVGYCSRVSRGENGGNNMTESPSMN